ncbi:LacI family DNA-binding transcriptional regulator [Bosea sp. (in: a-proteobacteria)]|uniref:LacI family DNA-binding transcriptional regulator n=1 Tax=Bosea sp. (in: a-proteobacteria) TaxID=1871050 RepID=UPI00262A799F|nr:LacI family DNA-binding transcriptional regulator [Bosea sp. (in: a-proteobacteria)]MCO5091289.1 LacI family transcriptional regulator [Bosea sp. (in: a-proteobacteria)]
MDKGRVTIRDVAARAGVSTATVSNVFSGNKPVNADLRERVLKAAGELAYQVDRAASQLRSGQARVVGVLVPDLDDVFFTSLVSQLEVLAQKDGYDILVASSRDDLGLEQSRLRTLLAWRPSGLIAVPCSDAVPDALRGKVGRLPIVFADRVPPEGSVVDTVAIDNREAGEIAARHLLAKGHRDILVAASSLAISPIRERARGACELIGTMLDRKPTVIELGSNADRGAAAFLHWLERHTQPSAVIALTNVTTLSTLSALARVQIDIPDPVSVVGFDDYPWMSARRTGLTAIRQPIAEIAEAAWNRLRARMAGDGAPPGHTVLQASLQARDSVRDLTAAAERGNGRASDPRPNPERPSASPKAVH